MPGVAYLKIVYSQTAGVHVIPANCESVTYMFSYYNLSPTVMGVDPQKKSRGDSSPLSSPSFPSPLLKSRPPFSQRAVSYPTRVWAKLNLVHFSLKIRHLVATILMIFMRIN